LTRISNSPFSSGSGPIALAAVHIIP
jgi:hypothetical protein